MTPHVLGLIAVAAAMAPAREVSVILVSIAGWLLFREPHPLWRFAGAFVVLAGIGLLALG